MKKLTPFQKKLARWYSAHKVIHKILTSDEALMAIMLLAIALPTGLIMWIFPVSSVDPKEIEIQTGLIIVGAAVVIVTVFVPSVLWLYWRFTGVNIENLPELASEDARKVIKKHLGLATCLDNLIKEANAEDDGTKLREYLNKVKKWEDMKVSLADTQKVEEDLSKKIAALEKELGL